MQGIEYLERNDTFGDGLILGQKCHTWGRDTFGDGLILGQKCHTWGRTHFESKMTQLGTDKYGNI